jgi:cellulose synthase/poly-beta-1,6-N-acetylglucosamine synthase-like glycosyltransferase
VHTFLSSLYGLVQVLFLIGLLVTLWFLTRKVNLVPLGEPVSADARPPIVLFYPVLRELEETMRTTFTGMAEAPYPRHLLRVIAIPNDNDLQSVASLQRLQAEFDFLEILPVPATTDPSWNVVWSAWQVNPKAYWWHSGRRAGQTALPPKKTRQLIWAMYQVAQQVGPEALLSYIDADSVVPKDYFELAAVGSQHYDVVQCTNITGNLMGSWASSFYAMDHISWDSTLYKHMTADGKQPFYVLGKGLFFRFRDLLEVGGFQPWLTIEDPEIGMRLWTNGRRLGVAESPLVEEVPATFGQGVTQRKRWVAGFFQSLGSPLTQMGMTPWQRFRARLNFVPCLSLALNPIGLLLAVWALIGAFTSDSRFIPPALEWLSFVNIGLAVLVVGYSQHRAWKMCKPVLPRATARASYLFRVNPVFLLGYWMWWTIPLTIGFWMFLRDGGLVWERTEKIDANHSLIRGQSRQRQSLARAQAAPADQNPVQGDSDYVLLADAKTERLELPSINVDAVRGPTK